MLAVGLLQVGCSIWATYLGAKTAMSFGRDVRASIFERVLSFSSRELNHFGAPSLITRNTNDVQQVQTLVLLGSTMFVAAPITMIGGIIMALRTDVGLSWLVAVSMPVLAISIFLVIRKMARCSGCSRPESIPSTASCASRSPASGWFAPSSASRTRRRASHGPTPSSPTPPLQWDGTWRQSFRS